jgi:acetyl-CoA C-acetyltransferase
MSFQKSKDDIVVVSAARTPFGRFGGSMKDIDIYDLGAIAMKNVMERIGLAPELIDEVWWGCGDTTNCKDPYTPVVARQSMMKAGIPPEVPSLYYDQACTTAMTTVKYGARSINLGEAEIVMTGGVTSFSTVPFLLRNMRWEGKKHSSFMVEDPIIPLGYKDYAPVAVDSGNVAIEYGVSREEQDEFAYQSHMKYGKAWERGFFKHEMVPLTIEKKDKKGNVISSKVLDKDEQYRPDITLEGLAKLKPIFGNPTCTAGNAPGMNDGATAPINYDPCDYGRCESRPQPGATVKTGRGKCSLLGWHPNRYNPGTGRKSGCFSETQCYTDSQKHGKILAGTSKHGNQTPACSRKS